MVSKPKKKTILVTGATGFIGRHLVRKLLGLNEYSVIGISRFPEKVKQPGFKLLKADITKRGDLKNLNKLTINIIIHCAACVESKNPKVLTKSNVRGTENVCKLAVELGVEKFIYLSSVAVVSGNNQLPLTEDLPYSATNNYGQSKLEAEKKVLAYRRKGLPIVILRPPMVYGEDEPHALPALIKLLRYRLIPVLNKGRAKLHLAYVENIVDAVIFSLRNQSMFEGVFFVADKEVLTVYQVFECLAKGIGAEAPLRFPDFCTALFCRLPFLGKYLRFFLKNRVYSTVRIESLGFHPVHKAGDALVRSSKNCKV